jgi:hypothetical protein
MKKIITPGILFLAMALSSACTETEDTDVEEPDQTTEAGEPTTTPVACCAPDVPRGDEPIVNSFELGRRARERLDFLRRVSSN